MSCPHLAIVTVSFCRAYPVKKLLPTDRIAGTSRCDGESWSGCPVLRDALAERGERLEEPTFHAAHEGGKS